MALAAIISLALGIGANTTIFTLLNAILLRPLPVEDPARLAAVSTVDAHSPGQLLCSYPNYQDYRDRNGVFTSLLLYSPITLTLTGHGDPQLVMGQIVSGNYFETLGVRPAVGRGFLPREDAVPGAWPVAVISHNLWARQFGGDPRIAGRKLEINGRAYDVVGVAPQGFQGLDTLIAADVWVPVMMYEQAYPNPAWIHQRRALAFSVAGRLKAGVTLRQAQAGMETVARDLEREYPRDNEGRRVVLAPLAQAAISARTRPVVTNAGAVLMIISGLVLLIACANVANLLLVRASRRGREIAVRLAMGAGRWRLVRQMLAESLLLALAGGAAGILAARWARDILWAMRPPMLAFSGVHLDLDGRVLGYTMAVAAATGLLFGLVPALRATRTDLAAELRERAATTGGGTTWQALVACQFAFSLVALVGAGLFMRSLHNAEQIDPGFQTGRLGIIGFNLAGYGEGRGREFQRQALERAAAVPGVAAAALAKDPPFTVSLARTVLLEGQSAAAGRMTLTSLVSPGYFRTAGIPLASGRDFTPLDTADAPRVAIVNEAFAASRWPGENPLGERLRFAGDDKPAEVIGVARNANYQVIGEAPQALFYLSQAQYYFPSAVLYLRTAGDPAATVAAVRREVQSMDRSLLLQAENVRDTIRQALWAPRLSAWLLGLFGGLGLALAGIGIYGVISYSVAQRGREIGVRMALGATPGKVRLMIAGGAARVVAAGVLTGLGLALAAVRAVGPLLLATSPYDALTFVAAPAILAVTALGACWIPAFRATRIEPAKALREE